MRGERAEEGEGEVVVEEEGQQFAIQGVLTGEEEDKMEEEVGKLEKEESQWTMTC